MYKDLLEYLVKNLVTNPDKVVVREEQKEDSKLMLHLSVDSSDMGRIIGKEGRIIRAIRERMIEPNGIIFADNILYKGYVMSDYNKHKQRTAVRNLREYIKEVSENPNLETEILEVGDGLAISRIK